MVVKVWNAIGKMYHCTTNWVIRLMAALHLMPMASFQILLKQWNTKTTVIPVLHRYHVVYGSSSEKTKDVYLLPLSK